MKKHSIKLTALVLALVLTAALALTGCGSKSDDSGDGATTIQIAVPNDTTNEARALLLLQDNGIIKLADGRESVQRRDRRDRGCADPQHPAGR